MLILSPAKPKFSLDGNLKITANPPSVFADVLHSTEAYVDVV